MVNNLFSDIIFNEYNNKYIRNSIYQNLYDIQIIHYIIQLIFISYRDEGLLYKHKLFKKNININTLKNILYESYNYIKLYKENVQITGDFKYISLTTLITYFELYNPYFLKNLLKIFLNLRY